MKNKIYTLLTGIFLIATIYITYSKYNSIQKSKQETEILLTKHDSVQKQWQGRVLKFPEPLYNLKVNVSLKDQLNRNNKEYTIISYLDADCSDCVRELNKWSDFLSSTPQLSKKLDVIFIASSSNVELFKYQVYDQAKFAYNIFFDDKNKFIKLNEVSSIKTYQTFLLKDNKVVYIGSPIKDKLFEKELKQILN